MPYRKNGINPQLISIITKKSLESIGESPTESMLPGTYARMIRKAPGGIKPPLPQKMFKLICGVCGRSGNYTVGLIAIDLEKCTKEEYRGTGNSWQDGFQFSDYFRCRHCNAAGNWQFPPRTATMLQMKIIGAVMSKQIGLESNGVVVGRITISGDRAFQWASDAESFYLEKLRDTPGDGWIWNRLGNVYYKGGRADLAVVAYEESLKHDPHQVESHYSLGKILFQVGETEAAIQHFRRALHSAHDYQRLEPLALRDMLSDSLFALLDIVRDAEVFATLLPCADELEGEAETRKKHRTLFFTELDLDLSQFEGMYPLAEVYMGKQQKQIPLQEKPLSLPPAGGKKKKKKKKNKRK